MNRTAQSLVLTAIGGVALRVGITDEHANYVNSWMQWPLVVSGLLLIGLAFSTLVRRVRGEQHAGGTGVAWLLVLPVVIGLVVQPPALGGYVAERRANDLAPEQFEDAVVAPLDESGENVLPVSLFVARANLDDGETLRGTTVRLTGFVTVDDAGGWYVTRLSIACCAADAGAFRVRVEGAEAPPVEQWVDVVGTWVEGTGTEAGETPTIAADRVVHVDAPKQPYE